MGEAVIACCWSSLGASPRPSLEERLHTKPLSLGHRDLTVAGGDVEIVNGIIYCGESHPGAMNMSNGTANAQITYALYGDT